MAVVFAVRIRTPRTGTNATGSEFSFGKIEVGKPIHVIVSYFDGKRLLLYLW